MAQVHLRGVKKTYDNKIEVIHGIDMEIADGEFIVIVGPSGCGKSTLLRMVAGLERITGGEVAIGDRVVNELEPKDRDIAMVFQNYALYPHMSVYQNMAYGLKIKKMPKDEIERRVQKAAKTLELGTFLQRLPRQLSGGQRQRVAMGRAIVREPAVFLFDEPLSNLDAKLRVQMRAELQSLHRRLGTTSLYVTHDQVEAMTLAHRMIVMNAGHAFRRRLYRLAPHEPHSAAARRPQAPVRHPSRAPRAMCRVRRSIGSQYRSDRAPWRRHVGLRTSGNKRHAHCCAPSFVGRRARRKAAATLPSRARALFRRPKRRAHLVRIRGLTPTFPLKTTPFHARTAALCASHAWRRWAGYIVASSYELSHEREYHAIRSSAALFDVSPLYKYSVRGKDAASLLDQVVTRNIQQLQIGQVAYTPWCDAAGKVLDDGTIARLDETTFRMTAAEPNLRWLQDNAGRLEVKIEDVSESVAALALQGPASRAILDDIDLKYFRLAKTKIGGIPVTVSRTGYTGDLGY